MSDWHYKGSRKRGQWIRTGPANEPWFEQDGMFYKPYAIDLKTMRSYNPMATKDTPIQTAAVFSEEPDALDAELFADTGNFYMTEDEKVAHIEKGTRFYISGVSYDDEGKFGARYLVSVTPADLDNASTKGWSFTASGPKNHTEARDASLNKLMEALEASGGRRIGPVVFVQKGNYRTIAAG